jgi:hypothetical protein
MSNTAFTPKIGQRYWYITGDKNPVYMWDVNYGRFIDFFRIDSGNCFKFRKFAVERGKELIVKYNEVKVG